MARAGVLGNPKPYEFFGTYAGLPMWEGSLTLLAAPPGVGKTSWVGRMGLESSAVGIETAHFCYEHTEEELKFRLYQQAKAELAGAHGNVSEEQVEARLAQSANMVFENLNNQEDTPRAIEDRLLNNYNFPVKGQALVAIDYLSCVPVFTYAGPVDPKLQGGEATYQLRDMARRHGWSLVVPCAIKGDNFVDGDDLSVLFGDERVGYGADRVLLFREESERRPCGCQRLMVRTLKDRSGPKRTWHLDFWGERFYPALESEAHIHEEHMEVMHE
jgi:hypothetical protein